MQTRDLLALWRLSHAADFAENRRVYIIAVFRGRRKTPSRPEEIGTVDAERSPGCGRSCGVWSNRACWRQSLRRRGRCTNGNMVNHVARAPRTDVPGQKWWVVLDSNRVFPIQLRYHHQLQTGSDDAKYSSTKVPKYVLKYFLGTYLLVFKYWHKYFALWWLGLVYTWAVVTRRRRDVVNRHLCVAWRYVTAAISPQSPRRCHLPKLVLGWWTPEG